MAHVRLFRHYLHLPYLVLGILDLLVLVVAFFIAVFFRYFGHLSMLQESWTYVLPSALGFGAINILVMVALAVHQSKLEEGLTGMMLRTILCLIISLPIAFMAAYLSPDHFWYLGGEGVVSSASVFGFLMLGIVRSIFFRIVGVNRFRRRVLVLGAGERALQLDADLQSPLDRKGFNLIGFMRGSEDQVQIGEEKLIGFKEGETLQALADRLRIDEIVVAVDDRRKGGLPMEELLECRMKGVAIIDAVNFYERESRKVALEMITPGWLVFSEGFSLSVVSRFTKRAMDLTASVVLFVLALPLIVATVLAIKLEDGLRAPVFYSQERVGLNGRVFRVHKFRSMITDAEKTGAVWAQKNDTRVTRVGEFIRKVRIDELPQIFNVMKGEMAFVGPRPERPVFVEQLSESIPFYSERHRVKPGLTGWAQLCFAYADSEEDTREKLRYDLYYIKNQSVLLDILTMVQTVEVVLFKKGSR